MLSCSFFQLRLKCLLLQTSFYFYFFYCIRFYQPLPLWFGLLHILFKKLLQLYGHKDIISIFFQLFLSFICCGSHRKVLLCTVTFPVRHKYLLLHIATFLALFTMPSTFPLVCNTSSTVYGVSAYILVCFLCLHWPLHFLQHQPCTGWNTRALS